MLIDDARAHFPKDVQGAEAIGVPVEPSLLDHALCFDVTAVEKYLDAVLPDRGVRGIVEDIPNVAPPHMVWWMESSNHWGILSFNCAIQTAERGWDDPLEVRRHFECSLEDAHWITMHQHLHRLPGDTFMLGYFAHLLAVRADGGPIDWARCAFHPPTVSADQPDDAVWNYWWRNLYIACTALCFTHCKGVTVKDHQQPRQQRRAAERAGRPPLVTYKTIDIAPVTRILREEGHVEKTGIKHALHVCRAHFAHYTADKPLFGKYTGTFYRPLHVRGSLERGVTLKDYRVLGPPDAP